MLIQNLHKKVEFVNAFFQMNQHALPKMKHSIISHAISMNTHNKSIRVKDSPIYEAGEIRSVRIRRYG